MRKVLGVDEVLLTRIYIAGPMRGVPEFNFPSFREARTRLREAGWTVHCPAERDEVDGFDATGLTGREDLTALDFNLAEAFEACIEDILRSEAVALLPGWAASDGARTEAKIALLTGRPVFAYLKHRPIPLEPLDGLNILTRVEALKDGTKPRG